MENTDITTIAEQYRGDGYLVIVQPTQHDLPDFLAGLVPDMLARKEGENVVVEVVTKDGMKRKDHFLAYWIGKVNAQPGWRLDLIITDSSPWTDKVSRNSRDLDVEDVRERNLEARRTLEQGFLEPACLFAWALAEAAMRIVAKSFKIHLKNNMPAYAMKQMHTDGILSNADLEQLRRFMTVRNSVAHGLKTSDLDESLITDLMGMTEKLLSLAENANQRLAKT